jgi:cytochrome d ubiquinol oxidase subunit I
VFAFFLESGFLGLYLFGRHRVSKGVHWFSALMVALGSTLSAFWILVANSWQQTPAGFVLRNGRAEMTSFAEAVFNPSMWIRFFHTIDAALISGSFLMAGISAYYLLRKRETDFATKAMRVAVVFGLITSVLELMPLGHEHTRQVARTQPEKFAAIEGLYASQESAPLVFFAVLTTAARTYATVEIPTSELAIRHLNAAKKDRRVWPMKPAVWLPSSPSQWLKRFLHPADAAPRIPGAEQLRRNQATR